MAITSAGHIALQGMGGVGKTVLATLVAKDYSVRRTFQDGIIWLTLGQRPDLLLQLQKAGKALCDSFAEYTSIAMARMQLSRALESKACLLVLDDVWNEADTEPFIRALSPRSRVLITTRNLAVVRVLAAEAHHVDVLTDEQAIELLAKWSGQPVSDLPLEAKHVARECGNLPLALAMIGAIVGSDLRRWGNMLHRLLSAERTRSSGFSRST